MDRTVSVDQFLCKSWKKWGRNPGNDQISIWAESVSCTWLLEKSKFTETEKGKTGEK
jgi:hypothetical protein